MMGNESSQLSGLEIDEKAVEITDFWTHSSGCVFGCEDTLTALSIFIGDSFVQGPLWTIQTPLEKMTKNLMLHRHPCILKYVSSWSKGAKHYLAVEQVKPLAHIVQSQTPLQICIGLYSILKAITFLHEKAGSSHNNISWSAIYITADGSWKLGSLEYLCRYDELTPDYLSKTRTTRYEKAINPNEESNTGNTKYIKAGAIDKYAFAVLVHELLHNKNDDIPCTQEFKQFCKTELQSSNIDTLPNFNTILEHPYFTHDFIIIYSFLTELALKTETERRTFFTELLTKLKAFPEEIVARQLGELLLSRLVLLDETACKHFLPYVFKPRTEEIEENSPLFSVDIFKQNIVPKLLHIYRVRDAQIRLLLLNHFKSYVNYFTKEQLQNHILPELLLGIKDTNDHLVSVTLIALSDLVPILGAAVVIGGNRLKLFNDGRPNTSPRIEHVSRPSPTVQHVEPYPVQEFLPERPSPDGGEDLQVTETHAEEDLDSWSDWDSEETQQPQEIIPENFEIDAPITLSQKNHQRTEINTDILNLDIKNLKQNVESNELDYFLDMEPVIEKTNKFFVEEKLEIIEEVRTSQLDVQTEENINEECWGDDLSWADN